MQRQLDGVDPMSRDTSRDTGPDTSPDAQRLAATYGPMLDALQAALDDALGPVSWDPRAEAREVVRHDGSRAHRVGSIHGRGVRTGSLDLARLSAAVNGVLPRWRFPEQPKMTGSPSGHLVCEAVDPHGAELTVLVKGEVSAWVERPL